jgi:MoaA/NifB/PqqE/SkfB family radical SAM enzyme
MACKYCPRKEYNTIEGDMDITAFNAFIRRDAEYLHKKLRGAISLSGWGEPLIYPWIKEMVNTLSDLDFEVGITTNTRVLTAQDYVDLLHAGLDYIAISIDHAPVDTIHLFKYQGIELVAKKMIRMETDENVAGKNVQWLEEVPWDIVHLVPNLPERQKDERKIVAHYIQWIKNFLGVEVLRKKREKVPQIISPYHQPSFKHRAFELLRKGLTQQCSAPVFINWQGLVSPCNLLTGSTWGNVFEERLETIINRMFKSRRRYARYCRACQYWN